LRRTLQRLTANTERLAVALLGQPTVRSRSELRWGAKGSLVVNIAGARAGRWYSFEEAVGGDMLDLVSFALACDSRAALAWARQWTGVAS
jgi:hypothetical protein